MGPGLQLFCTVYSNDVSVNQIAPDDMHPDFLSVLFDFYESPLQVSFAGLCAGKFVLRHAPTPFRANLLHTMPAKEACNRGEFGLRHCNLQLPAKSSSNLCMYTIHRFVAAKVSTMTAIKNETRIDDDEWQQY